MKKHKTTQKNRGRTKKRRTNGINPGMETHPSERPFIFRFLRIIERVYRLYVLIECVQWFPTRHGVSNQYDVANVTASLYNAHHARITQCTYLCFSVFSNALTYHTYCLSLLPFTLFVSPQNAFSHRHLSWSNSIQVRCFACCVVLCVRARTLWFFVVYECVSVSIGV